MGGSVVAGPGAGSAAAFGSPPAPDGEVTDKTLAREEAKAIVARLRESNEQAAESGAPKVEEAQYQRLQRVMTRKLQRS